MDNQIYGLTKGQLSPTSRRGLATASSALGSMESPVNPLLYVLGYGAEFVAQGTPADMNGLAKIIEEGIRFPGFAFINVQSPCVTYGQEDQMLKAQKATDADARVARARSRRPPGGHGPGAGVRRASSTRACSSGSPSRARPSSASRRERHEAQRASVKSRADVLNVFRLKKP